MRYSIRDSKTGRFKKVESECVQPEQKYNDVITKITTYEKIKKAFKSVKGLF